MQERITVLIVDDYPLVREGMKTILERFPDLSVVASVKSGEQAVSVCDSVKPDIVLMDVNLPDMTGIEAMERIHRHNPHTKVLMFTSQSEHLHVQEALDKGALGYLIKNAEITELVRAIRSASEGKHTLSPEAVKSLIQNRPKATISDQELTRREIEILTLIAQGMTNQDIGAELSISVSTVKAYAAKIYKKLDVNSRSEAIAKAIRSKIIATD